MPTMYPVAGCKLFIGDTVIDDKETDFVEADFSGVTWTEVKGWTDMGPIGDTSQLITSDHIGAFRTKKTKGTRNAGSMQNMFDVLSTDAGQLALIAAEKTNNNYGFRVQLNDAVGAGAPSQRYFIALTTGAQEQGGGANTVRKLMATAEINSNIVRVAAA